MTPPAATATGGRLGSAVRGAHLPTLLMALVQLTGDRRWLDERYRPVKPRGASDPDDGGLPEDVQEEIRAAAVEAVRCWREGGAEPWLPPQEELPALSSFYVGEPVDEEYAPLIAEEVGLRDRDITWSQARHQVPRAAVTDFTVAVVGAGLAGVAMAIKLEQAKIPYVVIEKNAGVGGTWRENDYPGCKVDSPSHLYQYSFERRPDWPGYYSRRDDNLAYVQSCAEKYGVLPRVRFDTELTDAVWDEDARRWTLHLRGAAGGAETLEAAVLVTSVGQLNRPQTPRIEGAESFAGAQMHTARWDRDVPVAGRRLACVGTGASAMQLVPALAGIAERVTVFQRSPQWAVPNSDLDREVDDDTKWLHAHVPFFEGWYRFRQFWMWNDKIWPTLQVDPDWPHQERSINASNEAQREFFTRHIERDLEGRPDLLAKCLPTYPPYGKRMLMDAGWFRTMARDDVELVTEPIERITPAGIVTADGVEHEVDVIAYATGFAAKKMLWPMEVRGRDGVSIRDVWGEDDPRAYLGITVPGFPNLFCLYGPNTNLGHGGSITFHNEVQARYVMGMLRKMIDRDIAAVEVRREVHDEYNERVDVAHDRMIWAHEGMDTWYRNAAGRVVTNSPWRLIDYWNMTLEPDLSEYHLSPG